MPFSPHSLSFTPPVHVLPPSWRAGGSMVAPSVPCTLLTPLSPHSLSFRPLIIPESAALTVRVPTYARSHAR